MDYELAKELKEAGFPQIGHLYGDFGGDSKEPFTSAPPLDELIEACGDLVLTGGKNEGWMVIHEQVDINPTIYSTPTEAVARCWLALNKK